MHQHTCKRQVQKCTCMHANAPAHALTSTFFAGARAVLVQLHDKAKDGLQSKTGSEEVAVQRAAQVR